VVQRGDADDEVERAGREREGEEVAEHILDDSGVSLPPREVEACAIDIDCGDVRNGPPQLTRERALATPDVERPFAVGWQRREQQSVVVQVAIPAPQNGGLSTSSTTRSESD
jgi:hypothetical protein